MPETITLTIEKFAPPGNGLGFYRGKAVFVPLTLPGDEVEVRVEKEKKSYLIGRLERVVRPGEKRREPSCSHYRECGGCDLLHLAYVDQVDLKRRMLNELLEHAGVTGCGPVTFRAAPAEGIGSRHRALFHYDRKLRFFGFRPRRRHQVVAIDNCRVLAPGLKTLLDELNRRTNLPPATTGVYGLASSTGEFAAALVRGRKITSLDMIGETIFEDYGFGRIELTAAGFAQNNPGITGRLAADLVDSLPEPGELAELYGGSGTFTLALAARDHQVTVYESDRRAVARARRNLAAAGRKQQVRLLCAKVEEVSFAAPFTAIIADPPRGGLPAPVRRKIIASPASHFLYVSCNPATLTRDLAELQSGPEGFSRCSLSAYDMYPGTTHLEVLARLSR